MSVPAGVDKMALRRSSERSVFLRYKGSQLRRVWREGVFAGVGGVGRGTALSGKAFEEDRSCTSDILGIAKFVICAEK